MATIDHILFSVDDPFADNFEAVDFLNTARISKEDREKLAHRNAERILKLSTQATIRNSARRSSMQDAVFAFKARTKAQVGVLPGYSNAEGGGGFSSDKQQDNPLER